MSDYSCLVVEDSPMMRQLIVFALARVKRIQITEAEDGVDALRKLASTKYDLILTDINMPVMDGLHGRSPAGDGPRCKRLHHQADSSAAGDSEGQRVAQAALKRRIHFANE